MQENTPEEHISRRRFLLTAASASAFFVQGCASMNLGADRGSETGPAHALPDSDHPLASLSFPQDSVVERTMNLPALPAPVHTAESGAAWHVKGVHPYVYSIAEGDLPAASADADIERWATGQSPPAGMRSAPPIGGYGAGTVELRADGSLADWQIFNNSPAGGGGNVQLNDAFFGIRTRPLEGTPQAWTVRTHPPAELPGLERLAFAGAFPVARLQLADSALPLRGSLYAYSDFNLHDAASAASPAVVFSFVLSNPTSAAIETSIMFNLPNHIEGTFRTERGFVLSRSGADPVSGEMSLSFASSLAFSSAVASDLDELWKRFEEKGDFAGMPGLGIFEHGAIATKFILEAGASRTVTMILAWHFPHRSFAGDIVGNAYAARYASASAVAAGVNDALPDIWRSLLTWDALFSASSLPNPVHQALRNNLAQLYKTTFCTADGRWRSWDSFATPHLASLDSLLTRAVPLLIFQPSALPSQLRAFAARQEADGRIPPMLGQGNRFPMDRAPASFSARTIPAFILAVCYHYQSTADEAFLKEMWPHIVKALSWQLAASTSEGLPSNLPELGNWSSYSEEGIDLANALLQIGALSAVQRLARVVGQSDLAKRTGALATTAAASLRQYFWTGSHYRARWTAYKPPADAPDDASLLGFVWLYLLGFEGAIDREALVQHLSWIQKENHPAIEPSPSGGRSFRPAASWCWSALHLFVHASDTALGTAESAFGYLAGALRDAWGHYDEVDVEKRLPLANPHHASHLAIWFVLRALTGQRYNAGTRTLQFSPAAGSRFRLPFFTPGAHGFLVAQRSGRYQMQVLSGRLELEELLIGDAIRYRDVYLEAGETLEIRG